MSGSGGASAYKQAQTSYKIERILRRFKDGLTGDEIAIFSSTTIEDLWKLAEDFQKEQSSRHCMQAWARIEPFVTGIKNYSAVIEVFVQGKPEILAFIWVFILSTVLLRTRRLTTKRGP